MANEEHLNILGQGIDAWNRWRATDLEPKMILEQDIEVWDLWRTYNFRLLPNLSEALLSSLHLEDANFSFTNFIRARLNGANLSRTDLRGALLSESILRGTHFVGANMIGANFHETNLQQVNLTNADLSRTSLLGADFSNAILTDTNLSGAAIGRTTFDNCDLSTVKGLDTVRHAGPSTIGVGTLYKSGGNIPESFLRGCGVPDNLITYIPSLVGAEQAIQFYSCFISYSHKDKEFAEKLYSRMRTAHLRVWFAPEDVMGGEKLYRQIDRAIQIYDKLLIILSENSLQSEWVMTEIRSARRAEIKEKRRKLFPIRLVNFEKIQEWECFDADTGKDLAVEVREYYIPNFSNWQEQNSFEAAFSRLLKDLQAAETNKAETL